MKLLVALCAVPLGYFSGRIALSGMWFFVQFSVTERTHYLMQCIGWFIGAIMILLIPLFSSEYSWATPIALLVAVLTAMFCANQLDSSAVAPEAVDINGEHDRL